MHYWERYAWIVLIIFYLFMWGLAGKQGFDIHAQEALEPSGLAYAGSFLSFGVSILQAVSHQRTFPLLTQTTGYRLLFVRRMGSNLCRLLLPIGKHPYSQVHA